MRFIILSFCFLITDCKGVGNSSSGPRTTPANPDIPNIAITSPIANTVTTGTLTLEGTCEGTVPTVDISGATPTSTSCSGGSFSQSITLSGSDDFKPVTVSQTNSDGSGNNNRNFILDTTAPASTSIGINSDASYTNSTSATLTLTANDVNLGVQMYVTNIAGCGSGGIYEAFISSKAWTLGQTNGTATVYVKFKDSVGNESGCTSATIIQDNTIPSISYSSPSDGSYGSTGVTVTGSCENGLTVTLNGSGIAATTTACSGGTFTKAVTFTSGEGNKAVSIGQTDLAGNSSTVNRNLIRDNTVPSDGTFLSPPSGLTTSNASFIFNWNGFTDNNTVNAYKIDTYPNNNCSGSPATTIASQAGTSYSLTLNAGDNSLKIYGIDGAGNTSTGVCSNNVNYNPSGTLDSSFGSNGIVSAAVASYIGLQSDNKIITGGSSLSRFNTNGLLDSSFGSSGIINSTSNFPAIDSNGNIYVISGTSGGDYFLTRYDSTGSVDISFATNGTYTGTFNPTNNALWGIYGILIQNDDKPIVFGSASNGIFTYTQGSTPGGTGSQSKTVVQRLTVSGFLDTSFSSTGTKTVIVGGYSSGAISGKINPSDGKIVIAGSASNGKDPGYNSDWCDIGILRLNTDGSTSLSVKIDLGDFEMYPFLDIDSNGKYVIAETYGGTNNLAIARITTSGTLDATFNSTGKLITTKGAPRAITLQADDKILISTTGSLIRYMPTAQIDTLFGTNGTVTLPSYSYYYSLRVDANGGIFVGGTFGLEKYLP